MLNKIALITLACALCAAAQDKVTVPLTNPSQPVTIKANFISNSVKVIAGAGREVVVSTSDGRKPSRDGAPPGMVRIGSRVGFSVEEDHNVVTISPGSINGGGDFVIEVPVNTNVQLHTVNGRLLEVSGVNGDHEIESTNGAIQLDNISGTVVAHTTNGSISVSLSHITGSKPMSFTSLNGKVDVTLPADTKARLRLKSDNGSIYSDFDVKLEADSNKPTVEDSRGRDGKYKISVDKAVSGTINGGGPEYTFQTMNGNILIHKK